MRPLLWKEMRELRLWLAGGALLVSALELLLRIRILRDTWAGAFYPLFLPLLLTVAAVGLAAGQIARERHARSLDFLLARPVSPGVILWAKFLAGTAALALLVAGIVALGFIQPELWRDNSSRAIQQTGYRALLLVFFPRYWCIYAVTLFLSVLLDRAEKVATLMAVVAVALPAWAIFCEGAAPFSGFVYWLPFIDSSFGPVLAAKSAAILSLTGAVFSGAALLLAVAGAALLKRSPERYMGNAGFAATAVGIAGAAILSAHGASHRLPAVAPVASLELDEAGNDMLAANGLVAVLQGHAVRFLDFSTPSQPRQVSLVPLPVDSVRFSMDGDTVFVTGQKKDLPVDREEIAMVRPSGLVEEIVMDAARYDQAFTAPVAVGRFLYVGYQREHQSRVRVFDIDSRSEVASLPLAGTFMTLTRRGAYLYAASISALDTIDVSDPAHPRLAGSVPVRTPFLVGFPLRVAWQDDRLFMLQIFPSTLESFSLRDPAHPAWQASLEYHNAMHLVASGRALYRPWQDGVLEFRAEGNHLHAGRYLSSGREVTQVAVDGDRIFALTVVDGKYRLRLEMYR